MCRVTAAKAPRFIRKQVSTEPWVISLLHCFPPVATLLKLSFRVVSKDLWLNSGSASTSIAKAKHKTQSKAVVTSWANLCSIICYERRPNYLSNIHVKKCKKVFFPFLSMLCIEYFSFKMCVDCRCLSYVWNG